MADIEKKVTKGLECHKNGLCQIDDKTSCPYWECEKDCSKHLMTDALELLKEQEKEIKALRLLVEWAEECDFGFDQFHEEYDRYKDEIKDMRYTDGMIHVAKRTLEDHGAFEEGR